MTKKQEVWTKRCLDGHVCSGKYAAEEFIQSWIEIAKQIGDHDFTKEDFYAAHMPQLIPDDIEVCDACLLGKYMPAGAYPTHDSLDHYGYTSLWEEDAVVAALRKAEEA